MKLILNYLSDKYGNCVKYWWLIIILGIILIGIGVLIMYYPAISYITMSLIFGLLIIFSGVIYILMSSSSTIHGRGWLMASGIIEVIIGLVLTIWPSLSAATLPYFLGFWLLFKGFTMIGIGSEMSSIKGSGWGWTIIAAVLLLICALIILVQPMVFGIEAVIIWVSATSIFGGIAMILFGNKLNHMRKHFNSVKS